MKTHTKPYGYGARTPMEVKSQVENGMWQQREDGLWQPAKSIPYYSFKERMVQAWHVLTYKADALYWYFPKAWERTSDGFTPREIDNK